MEELFTGIITTEMAYLSASAIAILLFVGRFPFRDEDDERKFVNQTNFWKDYGIFVLVIVCLVGAFIPGVGLENATIGKKIAFGILSAAVSSFGRGCFKPLGFGRLEGKK